MAEALAAETPQRALERPPLAAHDMRAELAVRRVAVAFLADPLGEVEHDRHRQHVVLPGKRDQRLARLLLDVGRVDHGQPPGGQPLAGDVVQRVERVAGRRLVVLVVGDEPAEEVRGERSRSA